MVAPKPVLGPTGPRPAFPGTSWRPAREGVRRRDVPMILALWLLFLILGTYFLFSEAGEIRGIREGLETHFDRK